MADDITLNSGSGGSKIATDDDGTRHHQYVKLEFGADNTQTKVDASNPLPVVQTGTPGLPTGAATAAKQDTQITAEQAIQTAVELIDDSVATLGTTTYTEATTKGLTVGAVRRDADTTLVNTTNEIGPLQMDANGRLKVEAFSGETLPVSLATTGSGTATGAVRVELPTNGTGVLATVGTVTTVSTVTSVTAIGTSVTPGTSAAHLGKAEDAQHASGDTGVMALAVRSATPTDRSVGASDADYEPLAVNEVGALWTSLTPSINGGLSTFMASGSDGSSILVATAQAVKASAGALFGYYAYNPESAVTFVHFYNTAAASVTVGTTNPLFTIAIPATSAANLTFPMGVTFSNAGWSVAATTTAGGNTAPATGVSLVAWYK